jgi:ABC-type Fe3+-hydroxamate transport system substrate-binding protein
MTVTIRDDLGGVVELEGPVRRVVSLVPSLTAALVDLGKKEVVVGRTSFCPGREAFGDRLDSIEEVGGTKTPRVDRVVSLRPDLVLAVKEENVREHVEELRRQGVAVLVFDPGSLEDLPRMIETLGRLCCAEPGARKMAADLETARAEAAATSRRHGVIPAAYFIWKDPWMVAGRDTYIGSVLSACGLENPFPGRYPEVTPEEAARLGAKLILLSSEPFLFTEEHARLVRAKLGGDSRVEVCRGDLVGWYPSRTAAALRHLATLADPGRPR